MMQARVLFGIIGALMCMGTATASVIEVPGANDEMSGIYFFGGWKCAQWALSGRIDGEQTHSRIYAHVVEKVGSRGAAADKQTEEIELVS